MYGTTCKSKFGDINKFVAGSAEEKNTFTLYTLAGSYVQYLSLGLLLGFDVYCNVYNIDDYIKLNIFFLFYLVVYLKQVYIFTIGMEITCTYTYIYLYLKLNLTF